MTEPARRHGLAELWGLLARRPFVVPALVAWTIAIYRLLTGDPVRTPAWVPWERVLSNAGHAPLFGLQSLLIAHAVAPGEAGRDRRAYLWAAVTATLYGAGLEVLQGSTGRTPSVFDAATNAVGALGVPWALASGRVFGPRTLVVIAASLVTAGLATWETSLRL